MHNDIEWNYPLSSSLSLKIYVRWYFYISVRLSSIQLVIENDKNRALMRVRLMMSLYLNGTGFRNTLDGAGTPNTGISPPAGLAGCPLRLRRLTTFSGRFNARTKTGQSYLPDMRVIAARPATACLCADGCSPYTSLLKAGSWPTHSHTAFLLGAYRTYPVDLFNYRTVTSPHRSTMTDAPVPIGGGVESPLILRDVLEK